MLDVAQMRWLRRVCGVSRRENLSNDEIRMYCGLEYKLSYQLLREKSRFLGHILRMDDARFPKLMLNWNSSLIGWKGQVKVANHKWESQVLSMLEKLEVGNN